MVDRTIVLSVSKIAADKVDEKYGEENLALVMKNDEGKKTFIIPKVKGECETVELMLSKRDLREIAKLVKDGEDEDGVEIKLLVTRKPPAPPHCDCE